MRSKQQSRSVFGKEASGGARRAPRASSYGFALLLLTAYCSLLTASAQYAQPPQGGTSAALAPSALSGITIDQRLDNQLPLGATFKDEAGNTVRLGDYFGKGKPVVLTLVYYKCPMLCNQVLNGVVGGIRGQDFLVGKDFDVVTVSFDPRETPQDAAEKKKITLGDLRRPDDPVAKAGWHFLTGEKSQIDEVADAVGFRYRFDERTQQFAHASGIMVATPQGKLSRYFYGIEYAPRDLRLALVESSEGKIGSVADKLTLYCYHYDPASGRYGFVIMSAMRVVGVVTVFGVVALILILRRAQAGEAAAARGRGAGAGGTV
ncbi:MAG: SCO family protein [Acidobacteria bacterium]|nr:SCO family protein [Acidobacteriota bacterium]